ncbi:MAG TPA: thiamine pyrophosphate-binding protein [Stellaceae bacterium]|nr:thiamine pyrophosphate-binding protein [Stellaceae bacterium]
MSKKSEERPSPAEAVERPIAGEAASNTAWGSDAIAAVLRQLDIPFVALNPGASYRGLHDSLVNFLGNERPQMLLCLHEESAVAIAHGWAKVTERPMAAIVHSNVGLMHATMAIFNAWCDRAPMLLLGATGPVDAAKRRPWIDWIHTARDQGALIRHYTKWDDQPASVAAAQEALLRANLITRTAPRGPVYINLDASLQEETIPEMPRAPEMERYLPAPPSLPAASAIDAAAKILVQAKRPVIMVGRVSRDTQAWQRRIELAEALGARVVTTLLAAAGFPTDHPLHAAPPGNFLPPAGMEAVASADAILSLDWVDLAGALRSAFGGKPIGAKIVQVSVDQYIHNGWSMDYQGLPPVDLHLLAEPDVVVSPLLSAVRSLRPTPPPLPPRGTRQGPPPLAALESAAVIEVPMLATALAAALGDADATIVRLPLSWAGHLRDFRHPLDYLGCDGGGGVGAGPGNAVGVALALRGSGRLPVAIIGDGDFLMGNTALWTAAHYGVAVLIVVANNRSFFNDELHQERVAKVRGRPVANRWIGQAISEPDIDIAAMARAQGCLGIGPVADPKGLVAALSEGIAAVRAGKPCVIDVRVAMGYDPAAAAGMQRTVKA